MFAAPEGCWLPLRPQLLNSCDCPAPSSELLVPDRKLNVRCSAELSLSLLVVTSSCDLSSLNRAEPQNEECHSARTFFFPPPFRMSVLCQGRGQIRCGRSRSSQPTRAASPPTPLGPTLEMGGARLSLPISSVSPKPLYLILFLTLQHPYYGVAHRQGRLPALCCPPRSGVCGRHVCRYVWGPQEGVTGLPCACVGPNKDPVLWKGPTVSTSLSSRGLAPTFTNAWCGHSSCCGRSGECGGVGP